ncbi:LLM class flavin-dependent oxidoreductase [Candidatus Solirubrobacter pratensis]|uniref:LLM class flavin-dependent oxidoreductase n=1 Tax=Candidatus Solirubrobacter pratensis TaxID=1298857 RepID=UPI000417C426|nr:LLM class flavin-dependent oxidoreductase [Candidatus Solirubrobacter pratensis]
MELGIISLSDLTADPHTGRPVAAMDRLDDTLAYARAADQLGLDVFALGEHHSHKFAVASPAVALAAIAGQTERIRLSSGVTVLSALDPVRVYQDFAQLDLLSHGRAEIIAGRSAFAEPFALFGAPINEYDALFTEKLDLLLRLREHDQLTWSGRYRPPLVSAEIAPRAVQAPLPVWVGVGGTPASAARAGHLGLPMTLGYIGGTLAHARRTVEIYRSAGEAAGHDPEMLPVAISTHFYAADSEQDVAGVFDHYRHYLHPETNNGRGFVVDRPAFDAARRRDGALMIGTAEQLTEKILDAHAELGITRFIGQFDWGALPSERVQDSIARLAIEIAPAVRATASATVAAGSTSA